MNVAVKLGGFAILLLVVFVVGLALGDAVGPVR
jgi:hypothetical protein